MGWARHGPPWRQPASAHLGVIIEPHVLPSLPQHRLLRFAASPGKMAPGAFFSRFPFRRTSSQDIGDSTSASYGLSTAPPPTSTSRHQLSRAYSQVKSTSSLRRNAARWSVTSSGRQHHHNNNNNVTPTQTNERTVDDLFRRPLSHLSTNDTQERRKSVVGKQAITAASSRNSRIPLSPAAGRKRESVAGSSR